MARKNGRKEVKEGGKKSDGMERSEGRNWN
jgi:hypothetical protein